MWVTLWAKRGPFQEEGGPGLRIAELLTFVFFYVMSLYPPPLTLMLLMCEIRNVLQNRGGVNAPTKKVYFQYLLSSLFYVLLFPVERSQQSFSLNHVC